jgi:23S rRNA (pseudouridine1915-N3)-methyltransferase
MKAGPERELAERFLARFSRAAPAVGLDYGGTFEVVESHRPDAAGRRREESAALVSRHGDKTLVLLDESGRDLGSTALADKLAHWRDDGRREVVFAIGGPDGHDPEIVKRAEFTLAFGKATWPHQLVRVMLAEQLYRAVTILSGHPYHRG